MMSKLETIKACLECDMKLWQKDLDKSPNDLYYQGAVAALRSFKRKIAHELEQEGGKVR